MTCERPAITEQAVSAHAARLGEKLRREGLGTDHVRLSFHTSEHDRERPQRSVSTVVTLPEASNDTMVLSRAALSGVRRVWREWFAYSKAGIITTDLMPLEAPQRALIGRLDRERSGPLMDALDACNCRYGRGSVVIASAGLVKDRSWSTKFDMRSPRYTTRVNELPTIRAA